MPSEPEESNFKDKVRIPAYPTVEAGSVVWAYMGPPEKKPAPPLFEWTQLPEVNLGISKIWQQSNWLQALEGGIDSVHINFLHGGKPPGQRFDDNNPLGRAQNLSQAPVIEVVPTDYGYSYAGIRSMGAEGTNHVRAYHWIMPWYQIRPGAGPEGGGSSGHMWVPMDDENTMVFNTHWSWAEPLTERARSLAGSGNELHVDIDTENNFRSVRNMDNKYLIDRHLQKTTTYSGITGTNTQDRAIQESMGAIADRTLERLGTTDRAIINARRTLLKAIKTVQDGGEPPGLAPTYYKLRSIQRVIPQGVNWFEALKADLFQLEEPKASVTS
jgi:phenylpropionate dioxygenase-like ring-hydroxylating dioxygenase large terminal subunit